MSVKEEPLPPGGMPGDSNSNSHPVGRYVVGVSHMGVFLEKVVPSDSVRTAKIWHALKRNRFKEVCDEVGVKHVFFDNYWLAYAYWLQCCQKYKHLL